MQSDPNIHDINNLNSADRVLNKLFAGMLEKWDAALKPGSVKGVHELRIATRRLRSALRNLTFPMEKSLVKALKSGLKTIADALGKARDLDVAIIALEKLLDESGVDKIRNGIAELIGERKKARRHAHSGLKNALSAAALRDLRDFFDKALIEAGKKKISKRVRRFDQAGHEVVGKTLDEFCELSANIYRPADDTALHEFRIAAKRLRYAIELYEDCWGEPIKPFTEEVTQMQDLLGKVHDANVWLESLGKNLHDSREINPAHAWLLSEFVERRAKNYRAALGLYCDWKEKRFVEQLRSIVSETT